MLWQIFARLFFRVTGLVLCEVATPEVLSDKLYENEKRKNGGGVNHSHFVQIRERTLEKAYISEQRATKKVCQP